MIPEREIIGRRANRKYTLRQWRDFESEKLDK
jgi:hypothetical protein